MKTEFLANISHELRTPLTPITGFASILQTRDLPPERTRGFADEINVAADQMERVIGQLAHFATIDGGRLPLEPERSAEHPSELQPLMRNSHTVFCATPTPHLSPQPHLPPPPHTDTH